MSDNSSIEWTGSTWNPTTGCDRVSPGCDNCYALTLAKRLKGMGSAKYQRDGDPRTSGPGFGLSVHSDVLGQPMRWRDPRRIFVNSMSDLFHDLVPDRFIADVFAVMSIASRHTYQVLTKRHGRMRSLLNSVRFWTAVNDARVVRGFPALPWVAAGELEPLPGVWLGVSVENQQWADIRIPALLETPAAVRWISAEPLLGPIDLTRIPAGRKQQPEMVWDVVGRRYGVPDRWQAPLSAGLDWVVVGGESGPGARPMHPDWARRLRDQCVAAGVSFFFKQWGNWRPWSEGDPRYSWLTKQGRLYAAGQRPGPDDDEPIAAGDYHLVDLDPYACIVRAGKKAAGRLLDGRTWDEYPGPVREVSGV